MSDQPDGILAARVVIERRLTNDDDQISIEATDADGEELRMVEALGMIRFGETILIRDSDLGGR